MVNGNNSGTRRSTLLLLPFILTAVIIISDQAVKFYIASTWPEGPVLDVFGNDFLWILHVRNKAIAFSIGEGLPDMVKKILFIILPVAALALILRFYFKTNDFTLFQRWAIAGVIGGGMGNLIDRMFRPAGVVDFISVKLYGFLGFERWPTFNIADAAVVVCVFLFIFALFFTPGGAASAKERR
ncbi:MAG: signal peptidase II [Spirochaetaceae bacterium]|jgi:signal peptidase II|nr:signal peptidase II [Spirochaetaceae bacterium]